MEPTYKPHDPSWTAPRSSLTGSSSLSSPCTSSPYTSSWRPPRIFRGRRLLTLLSLFLKVRDRRQEPLDCSSCHETTWWIKGVHRVAATPVLRRIVQGPPESDPSYESSEAAFSMFRQRTTLSGSSLDVPPESSTSEHLHPRLGSKDDSSYEGTPEDEKLLTTSRPRGRRPFTPYWKSYKTIVFDPLANSMQSEYAATARDEFTAFTEPSAPEVTGGASQGGSTLPLTAASDDTIALSSRKNTTDSIAYRGITYGQKMYQAAYDQLLERLGDLTAVSSEVGDINDERTRLQFHPGDFRTPRQGQEAEQPAWAIPYTNIVLLPKELLMNASVLPGLASGDSFAEKPGRERVEQERPHVSRGWLLGILSCFIGAFCGSLGDNMVRRSFTLLQEKDRLTFFQMWRSPLWTIGMFLTIVVNTCCSVIGLAFAPATVVTSFAGVHIFWNTLLAKTLNREKATSYDYVGIVAVVGGIMLIVVYSGGNQAIQSYQAFGDNLCNPGPVAYILFVIILFALGSALECCPAILPWWRNASASVGEEWDRRARLAERFLLAATSGACGGLSNLLAKATILLLNATPYTVSDEGGAKENTAGAWVLRQGYPHLGWGACLLVVLTGAVATAQLLFLNASLRKFEAIYVVPTINSVLIVMGALGGIVLFREVPAQHTSFALGLISVVTGVTALSYGKYEAEQHLLEESQPKETALRNIAGREPGDPLLQRASHPEASLEQLGQEGPPAAHTSQVRGWCEKLFRPVKDASINILVRTNTLNTKYPAGLLNFAHLDSNANIRMLHQASLDISAASEQAESPLDSEAPVPRREQDKRDVRDSSVTLAG